MKNKEEEGPAKIHLNVPQLLYWMVQARISVLLWGRATGKTQGPGAIFTMNNMNQMPRSLGGIVSSSYDKLLTMVIPGLVQGWEIFGYQENLHYFIKKFAPENFFGSMPDGKPRKPFREPKRSEHYIPWWTGAGAVLISLDRPSTSVGINLDWLFGDEARLFREKSFNDVLLTVRGNAAEFGHLSCHGSILLTTDLPKDSTGQWLYRYLEEMDKETIQLIIGMQQKVGEINGRYQAMTIRQKKKADIEINKLNNYCNELRKDLVYVSFASTIDNIHALGLDVIKRFRRMLSDLDFQVSVLSKRLEQVENNFYISFDMEHNGYDLSEEQWAYVDSLDLNFRDNIKKDCRWDGDLLTDEPLDIACDYNYKLSCLVVGQETIYEDYVRNFMYAETPMMLKDLILDFCDYYRHHQSRTVNYYYDHTALLGKNASSDIRHCEEVCMILRNNGWHVIEKYIGQAPTHRSRYYLLNKLFRGDDNRLPKVKFHRTNCEVLATSMNNAGTKRGVDGIKKDKSSEDDSNIEPIKATHPTEALDQLLYGKHFDKINYESAFVDTF